MRPVVPDVPTLSGFDVASLFAARGDGGPISRLRFPDGRLGWLVTGHALAREVLGDLRFGTENSGGLAAVDPASAETSSPYDHENGDHENGGREDSGPADAGGTAFDRGDILFTDPPGHTVFRRLVAGHLTAKRVNDYRPFVERVVARSLDEMAEAGPPAEFKTTFALPVTIQTICAVLGLDYGLSDIWHAFIAAFEAVPQDAADLARAKRLRDDAVRAVIRERIATPADDLVSVLVRSPDVTEDQLVGVVSFLSEAGHFTTSNMLTQGVFTLLGDRAVWHALGTDPSVAPRAVDELLRYLSTVQAGAVVRTARDDVPIGDVIVRAGEPVHVALPAVNRDENVFPDPHRLDLDRDASAHLAFSYGVHQCLGQHLARMEMTVAFREVARRFPSLEVAIPADEVRRYSPLFPLNGLLELPVTWETR